MTSLPRVDVASRIPRLQEMFGEARIDCVLVEELANIRYLTGFTGSAAMLLVSRSGALLTTDGRYRTQAAEQLAAAGVSSPAGPSLVDTFVGRIQPQRDAVAAAIEALGANPVDHHAAAAERPRVGLEAEHVVWADERRWEERLGGAELVATSGLIEGLREVKDEGEVGRIARAAAIADAALSEVAPMIDTEPTESDVALALDVAMRRLGAEDRAFETIVASGPNAAMPHARPGPRVIRRGDPVVVDFGATVDGYRSDMTRTFFAGGTPVGTMREVYDAVLASQQAGVAAVRAGVTGGEVDDVCRRTLTEAGYGEAFEHGTGHGVGLDIHEGPSVGPGSAGILARGAVVTVEPGAYLAGIGGVRIEDTVVVTDDGCRVLTALSKSFDASSLEPLRG